MSSTGSISNLTPKGPTRSPAESMVGVEAASTAGGGQHGPPVRPLSMAFAPLASFRQRLGGETASHPGTQAPLPEPSAPRPWGSEETDLPREAGGNTLYRALFEAAFEGIVVCEGGRIVDLNEHLARLLGGKRFEFLGISLLDLVAPPDRARVTEALRTQRQVSYEFRFLLPDDSTVSVEGRTRPARCGDRCLSLTAIRDRTERRRAEEALQFSQERFALAMDAANDGLWDWHVPSGKGYFSPRYCTMLGYSPEELLPTHATFLSLLHPEERPAVEQRITGALTAGDGTSEEEFRMRTREGGWIWILRRGRVIERDPDGRPFRVMGTHSDISDRKRAEQELRKSEERLRQAVRVSQIGIFDHDHVTDSLYWSPEQRSIHGIPREGGISQDRFLALIHPEDRDRVARSIQMARDPRGDGLLDVEYRLVTPGGETRWLASRAHTLFEGSHTTRHAVRTIGAVLDLTDRKRAEERLSRANDELELRVGERTSQLEEAKKAAEAASEAKSRFLAVMSHEIRTPLNGVTGVLHLLEREGANPRQQHWIELARTSASTLLRVINDILDFSKVEAGKLDLRPRPIDLAFTITHTASPFVERAAARGLPCHIRLAPGLPSVVEGDADRIAQILGNLLGNALKFTERGSVTLAVRPMTAEDGRTPVLFEVTDTGIGIQPDQQHHLFQPFSQIDNSSTRRHGGTGLGLGICRQLVELMGGRIGVRSDGRTGATFWFVLPFQVCHSLAPQPTPVPSRRGRSGEGRVLLAEDNEINQELSREILMGLGYSCDCVSDGAAAIQAALSGRYDLVLMDCMMPGTDGYAATRAIRQAEARTPLGRRGRLIIVAMTASAMQGDREQCLEAGMDDYLTKPIDPERIEAVLGQWMPGTSPDDTTPPPGALPRNEEGPASGPPPLELQTR